MSDIHVGILDECDEVEAGQLARLLPQVAATAPPLTRERVDEVVRQPSTHVVVARLDGAVVGMAVLCVCSTFAGNFGQVEEVAVDEAVRGRHLSVQLMVGLLGHAAGLRLRFVDLTSRPARIAANGLYKKLGFELRETNCYRHRLDPVPEPW